ncbi:MAG: phosphoserine phosphatase SerB [Myxococcales bacterium]|nr:phosphoserine phosphatase SerB [Myxococcales bacterium]MBP6842286.1 phosphoserine phosphatase SerB [Kofleriaceae bacterium]
MAGYLLHAVADAPIDPAIAIAIADAVAPVARIDVRTTAGQHVTVFTCPRDGVDRAVDRAGAVALRAAAAAAIGAAPIDLLARVAPAAPPALVVMDMDSTILSIEVIDELARMHGVGDAVAAITERAMRGELAFEASLRERVRQLAGLPVAALAALATRLPLSPGAAAMIAALRARGVVFAIASGGFTFAADVLVRDHGFAHAFANTLGVADGALTGEVVGPVVTAEGKAAVVETLRAQHGLAAGQVIAIGDGANDRLMLAAAGLGVAFRPKPVLAAVADGVIVHGGLERVLAFVE